MKMLFWKNSTEKKFDILYFVIPESQYNNRIDSNRFCGILIAARRGFSDIFATREFLYLSFVSFKLRTRKDFTIHFLKNNIKHLCIRVI